MSRKDEARAFHYAVYDAVRLIPQGKVTSYGHIAKLVYKPRNSRHVGQALKFLQPAGTLSDYPYSSDDVPWWRVISSAGVISPREQEAMDRQAMMLRREGVEMSDTNRVSLSEYGWFPETEFDDYS